MEFYIAGYWKDCPEETFADYLVTADHTLRENDEEVFFYGLTEEMLKEAVLLGTQTTHDFVITTYRRKNL
jgi:hypothetical protein